LTSRLSDLHIDGSSSNSNSNSNSTPLEYLQLISKIDSKIYLDAVFEIINIQKILHHEISFIVDTFEHKLNIKEVWKSFAQRLQQTIQQHLYAIREVAESANFGRYFLLVNVEILEFDLKMIAYQIRHQYNGVNIDNATQKRTKKKCEGIRERTVEVIKNIRANTDNEIEESEFKSDIYRRLEKLLGDCDKVITCVDYLNTNIDLLEELPEMENLETDQITKPKFKTSGTFYRKLY
jgi:hypothetical protein